MSEQPLATPDGRYLIIDGRRWRATDPAIPEKRREELTRGADGLAKRSAPYGRQVPGERRTRRGSW